MKILLLDCDKGLEKVLVQKGHKVSTGSLGFSGGVREIPVALYEQQVIVFNPQNVLFASGEQVDEKKGFFFFPTIKNRTPEIERSDLKDFFENGGMCIVFYNPLKMDERKEFAVYNWLIGELFPDPTTDSDIHKIMFPDDSEYKPFKSLLREFTPKLPIRRKVLKIDEWTYPRALYRNQRGDNLAVFYKKDNGMVIALPMYDDNNSVVVHILSHVYPNIFEIKPSTPSVLDIKKSNVQIQLEEGVKQKEGVIDKTIQEIDDLRGKINWEQTRIENTISSDPTAKVILGYLEDMISDKNDIFHEAYKITDRLFRHYGDEKAVILALGMKKEIEFIRKVSNEGYRDTRHAPRPNEVIKPPTPEENKLLLSYSIAIVKKYIEKLI